VRLMVMVGAVVVNDKKVVGIKRLFARCRLHVENLDIHYILSLSYMSLQSNWVSPSPDLPCAMLQPARRG
jgi:hypothetical protein